MVIKSGVEYALTWLGIHKPEILTQAEIFGDTELVVDDDKVDERVKKLMKEHETIQKHTPVTPLEEYLQARIDTLNESAVRLDQSGANSFRIRSTVKELENLKVVLKGL